MINDLLHIDNQEKREPGLDYFALRKEGIKLIEQYCGGIWTDYNEHDPGITILEQLIYALTELSYRTGFEVKDLLTDYKTGSIHEKEQVLLSADEIFPCNPITTKDYAKLLYDNIKGLANSWLKPIPIDKYGINGLYKVSVFVYDMAKYQVEAERERIKSDIRTLLSSNRNLCEDFEEIELLEYVDFFIEAEIEITSQKTPEKILAEIFFRIRNYVAPEVKFYSYQELRDEGKSIDEIFTGPALNYGFIDHEELRDRPSRIYDTQIIDIINNIDGVKSIKNLSLSLNGIQFTKQVVINDSQILRYKFKKKSKILDKNIKFYKGKNTRTLQLNTKLTKQELENLNAEQRRVYKLDEQYKRYLNLPRGVNRKVGEYHSIQNQFPHIYGINHFGIPGSETKLRKAQAKQLKGYLLTFEQIMVNYLAQLNHSKDLFSIKENNDSTYFFETLHDGIVPKINELYISENDEIETNELPTYIEKKLQELVGKYDHNLHRKSKFLDYLLSLYGERFFQYSLSRLNYYYDIDQNEKNIIKNKENFLKIIDIINRRKGVGYDYLNAYAVGGNISGVELKTKMLLEINGTWSSFDGCSVLSVFNAKNLKLVSAKDAIKHDCYEFDEEGTMVSAPVNDSTVEHYFEGVSFDDNLELEEEEMTHMLNNVSFIQHGVIDESILRAAINVKNYKIGKLIGPDHYIIVLRVSEGDKKIWKRLGVFDGFEETKKTIYALIQFVRELNIESEDYHIIEHILLRPKGKREEKFYHTEVDSLLSLSKAIQEESRDFYSFRISVVLPNWTARFNDTRFQALAMETFHLNIPAHIAIDFLWLSPEEMCDFETAHCEWISKRSAEDIDYEALDKISANVEYFLRKYKAQME